jgi:AraC-like DNA-binding protein
MDPLSQTIGLLKPQSLAWRVIEAHDSWAIRFPAVEAVVFGQMIEGSSRVDFPDGTASRLEAGDFLLLCTPPSDWRIGTDETSPAIGLKALIAAPDSLLSSAPAPKICRLIAGAMIFAAPNTDLVRSLIPPLIHIRGTEMAAGRLRSFLDMLGNEALAERPGKSFILDRLLEVMLMECLRCRPAALGPARQGLLAGLDDPKIRTALQAMHADAQKSWTVDGLARHAGMSRSAFAARFHQVVGASPIDYLSGWRINLAKAALTASQMPMIEVAQLAGYQSVSAFSTAFRRSTGSSPVAFVRKSAAEEPPAL